MDVFGAGTNEVAAVEPSTTNMSGFAICLAQAQNPLGISYVSNEIFDPIVFIAISLVLITKTTCELS